jgi:hypothetical protein
MRFEVSLVGLIIVAREYVGSLLACLLVFVCLLVKEDWKRKRERKQKRWSTGETSKTEMG